MRIIHNLLGFNRPACINVRKMISEGARCDNDRRSCRQNMVPIAVCSHAWAELQPGNPAMRDEDAEINWAELMSEIERIAARLHETGLQRGQSVAILGTSAVNYALVLPRCGARRRVSPRRSPPAPARTIEGMAKDLAVRGICLSTRPSVTELGDRFHGRT